MTIRRAIVRATPVALHEFAGRTLLDRTLDRLLEAGIAEILLEPGADRAALQAHLAARAGPASITLLDRDPHQAGDQAGPVLLVDGDMAWFDGPAAALARLDAAFDPGRFDGVLLLARATETGVTDRVPLVLDPLGIVRRPEEREIAPFVHAGLQLLRSPDLRTGWDAAIADARLAGLVHDGVWFDLPTPRAIEDAGHQYEDRLAGVRL